MKQNITLAVEEPLLKRARAFAAARGTSVSAMLADELRKMIAGAEAYDRAKARALAHLNSPFPLGGKGIANRELLHDRKGLR